MKAIELFAGIGGIALAAEWVGIETVAFCEREPFCQKILQKHWPNVPIFDDIRTLNKQRLIDGGVDVGAVELISGGFPCQPYSVAGKRKGTADDRDLWPEMFRIIEEIKPTWVVGENVANFVNMELDRTLSDLESIGYEGESFIIPACAVDAKHQRSRTFIVAYSQLLGCRERTTKQKENGSRNSPIDASNCCKVVSNSNSKRCRQMEQHDSRGPQRKRTICTVGQCDIEHGGSASRWKPEPNVGRVAHGIPNRVDRIRGLGNAVVPQQIYPIFKYIKLIHEQMVRK